MAFTTRFAPSPTGLLHRGHALSALTGWAMARAAGGRFLLRIEDIDQSRCRPEYNAAILEDLHWLGIDWDGPVIQQSARSDAYGAALDRLRALGVAYPCICSRADIAAAASAPHGPGGPIYPGTCRNRDHFEGAAAWRLDIAKALALSGPLEWHDAATGTVAATPDVLGDIVIARRDIGCAYHVAAVVDDGWQGVSDVVRGDDLFAATHVQRLLQALLGLPAPRYHHHPLLLDANGQRLAKRSGGETLASLRAAGAEPIALRTALMATATPWRVGGPLAHPHL